MKFYTALYEFKGHNTSHWLFYCCQNPAKGQNISVNFDFGLGAYIPLQQPVPIGGGFYVEGKTGYGVLKYQMSKADAFEALKTLDVPLGLPSGKVYVIRISFFAQQKE